ncbi:MAG: hypothetical protein ACRC2T_10750 [Thermoguttaceae bacterium]
MSNLQISKQLDISPELSSLEARLSQIQPTIEREAFQPFAYILLLEQCRLAESDKSDKKTPISEEKLVETIVTAGKNEVTLSLSQYVQSIRISSMLIGLMIGAGVGVLVGCIFCFGAFKVLNPSIQSPQNQTYERLNEQQLPLFTNQYSQP